MRLRRPGGFAAFAVQRVTLEIHLQLTISNLYHIFIILVFGSLTDQLNHSRRDNSIAAGPQAAGVHRLVEAMRSILHHAAQNLLSTPKMSVSFTHSLLSHSFRSGPGHRRPMSGRGLQQEAGRGRHGRSSGRRFPFPSAPPPPTVLPLSLFM